VQNSEILRFENYLRFHLTEIQEQLRTNVESESDRIWSTKWGSSATVLKEYLIRGREEITSALTRIQEGAYGNCVSCGHEISQQRLKVVPWLKLCIVCEQECGHQSTEDAYEYRRPEITSWG